MNFRTIWVNLCKSDKICYQIDLEKYRDNLNIVTQLKKGLVFIMDYNEDRQVYDYNNETFLHSGSRLYDRIDKTNINFEAIIFLSTLGKGRYCFQLLTVFLYDLKYFQSQTLCLEEGNTVEKVSITES